MTLTGAVLVIISVLSICLTDSIRQHRSYFASIVDGNLGLNAVALIDFHNLREDIREICCHCAVVGERDCVTICLNAGNCLINIDITNIVDFNDGPYTVVCESSPNCRKYMR